MEPFKNMINEKVMTKMSQLLSEHKAKFNHDHFLKNSKKELSTLELKERVAFVALRLHEAFEGNYQTSVASLLKIQKNNHANGLSGFEVWPLTYFVSEYGLDDFEVSLKALGEFTKDFTSEWAIRAFIIKDFKKTKKYLDLWSESDCHHQRRLVSEGTRPLLPWGIKLHDFQKAPEIMWPYLEKLKNDESMYVRKSVANHINDHTKKQSDFVIEKLEKWVKNKKITNEEKWIIKHGLRSLIKGANPKALELIGVKSNFVEATKIKIKEDSIRLGESVIISAEIKNESINSEKVIVDVEVHLLKNNGSYNVKCFKGKLLELRGKEKLGVELKIPLKKVTTRKYYSGKHYVNLLVNGKRFKKMNFDLHV